MTCSELMRATPSVATKASLSLRIIAVLYWFALPSVALAEREAIRQKFDSAVASGSMRELLGVYKRADKLGVRAAPLWEKAERRFTGAGDEELLALLRLAANLGPMTSTSTNEYIRALKSESDSIKIAAVDALGAIGPTRKSSAALEYILIKSPYPFLQAKAAQALATHGPAAAGVIPAIMRHAVNPEHPYRHMFIVSLKSIAVGSSVVADFLEKILLNREEDEFLRLLAAETIVFVDPWNSSGIIELFRMTNSGNGKARKRAFSSLREFRPSSERNKGLYTPLKELREEKILSKRADELAGNLLQRLEKLQ